MDDMLCILTHPLPDSRKTINTWYIILDEWVCDMVFSYR
jgi:hypothetical protein